MKTIEELNRQWNEGIDEDMGEERAVELNTGEILHADDYHYHDGVLDFSMMREGYEFYTVENVPLSHIKAVSQY